MSQPQQHNISSGITIVGNVSGSGNLIVEGTIRGTIEISSAVTVEKSGRVEADIKADLLRVLGESCGNISTSSLVSIGAGAKVEGDIRAPRVVLEDGADFNGMIDMNFNLPEDI